MLRVKDPKVSIPFFEGKLGLRTVAVKRFPEWSFDLYFLGSLPSDAAIPAFDTKESNAFLWSFPGCLLEITHNYGTETKEGAAYATGHEEGHTGFHSVGFTVDDIDAAAAAFASAGIASPSTPSSALATILEPSTDYHVTLHRATAAVSRPHLHHAKLRVRDIGATLAFYADHFGGTHVATAPLGDDKGSSIYYVAWLPVGTPIPEDPLSPEALALAFTQRETQALMAFIHMPGTEKDASFPGYQSGNVEPYRGFGHIGFLTDGLVETCEALEASGVGFKKRPHEGKMRGLAFAVDPDGYWIEIIQRGVDM